MLQPAIMRTEVPTAAQAEWARCRPWIVAALETSPGLEAIEDVELLIGEGRYQFWAGKPPAAPPRSHRHSPLGSRGLRHQQQNPSMPICVPKSLLWRAKGRIS